MSKVKVTGPDFRIFHHCEIERKTLLATLQKKVTDLPENFRKDYT